MGLFLLSERQMARIAPHFPLAHGVPRVDDRRVVSGIVYVIRNGLQWKDAPAAYGPHKTLCNCFIRWSRMRSRTTVSSSTSSTVSPASDRGASANPTVSASSSRAPLKRGRSS
jgi:hypothetical protein